MASRIRFGATLAVCASMALLGACSSAPEGGAEQADEALGIGLLPSPLPTIPMACAALPALKSDAESGGTSCYGRVLGFEVRVARDTTCPTLTIGPGLHWAPDRSAAAASIGPAVPMWPASAPDPDVCTYSYSGIFRVVHVLGRVPLYPTSQGVDEATEATLVGSLCEALRSAGVAVTGWRYDLPARANDGSYCPGTPVCDPSCPDFKARCLTCVR